MLKLAEPGAQQASTKMAKPSTLAALKGFLRSPPPADDAADQRSPKPQVGVRIRLTALCVQVLQSKTGHDTAWVCQQEAIGSQA